jgi:hypothetical protein
MTREEAEKLAVDESYRLFPEPSWHSGGVRYGFVRGALWLHDQIASAPSLPCPEKERT